MTRRLRYRWWWARRIRCILTWHDPENIAHRGEFWCRRRCGKGWRVGAAD